MHLNFAQWGKLKNWEGKEDFCGLTFSLKFVLPFLDYAYPD